MYADEDFIAMLVACLMQYLEADNSADGPDVSRYVSDKVHMCRLTLDLVDAANTFGYHVVQTHTEQWSVRQVDPDSGRISLVLTANPVVNTCRQFVGGEPTSWREFATWEQLVLHASQVMEGFRPNQQNQQPPRLSQIIDDQPPYRPRRTESSTVPAAPPPPPPPPPPAYPTITHDGVIPSKFADQARAYNMLLVPRGTTADGSPWAVEKWVLLDECNERVMGEFFFRTYKALMFPRESLFHDRHITEFQFATGEDFDRGIAAYIDHIGGRLERDRRAIETRRLSSELQQLRAERRELQSRANELQDELNQLRPHTDPDGGRRRHIDFG